MGTYCLPMRRAPLPPPRAVAVPLTLPAELSAGAGLALPALEGERARRIPGLYRRVLPGPLPAPTRLRHFFDPRSGWFRRTERAFNQLLCRSVWPLVPGVPRIYSRQLERTLTLSEGEVRLAGLTPDWDGTRILFLSDLHVGPFLDAEALQRCLARLVGLRPDLILLGGDLATARLAELPPSLPALGTLEAPLGVFSVLGNHDHYTEDASGVVAALERSGIRVLLNRSVVLSRGEGRLVLAGIDDLHVGRPDLDGALAGAAGVAAGTPVVLLSHNPDAFFHAARRGVSLMLSGHTHGGQVRLPGLPVLVRMSRYRLDEGRYTWKGAELLVSRGLGVTGLPLRFGCSPEAVLLTLRPGAGPR
jgi:uncharacterized protein